MKLVLDTSGYICCQRRHPTGLHWLEAAAAIFIPIPALAELMCGFLKGDRFQFNATLLTEIVERLDIEWIDADQGVAEIYARVFDHLRRKGRPIPINDLWISACCISVNGTLLTTDRHFLEVEGLRVELL